MKTIIHFDIESTGTSVTKDRIIQLSLIRTTTDFKIIEKKKLWFNNSGVPIHPKAFEAHGISEEMLKDKPLFQQQAQKIHDYIQNSDYIHGYNIKHFDIPMLSEEFGRCGIDWIPKPAIDSCVIFKKRESRTLSAAVKFYNGKEMVDAHDAENDVIASIEVLESQSFQYGLDTIEQLIEESKYEGEEKRLTYDGKIVSREHDGVPCWNENFGKNKGKPILDDKGYLDWILREDFPYNTKQFIHSLLNK